MTPSNVRDGLKTRLQTIAAIRNYYDTIPDSINTPAAIVGQLEIEWDASMVRGSDRGMIDVLLFASRMSERSGQDLLDGFLDGTGSLSVKAAIEADRTLGGAVNTTRVQRSTPIATTIAGVEYLGYRYEIEVIG